MVLPSWEEARAGSGCSEPLQNRPVRVLFAIKNHQKKKMNECPFWHAGREGFRPGLCVSNLFRSFFFCGVISEFFFESDINLAISDGGFHLSEVVSKTKTK